MGFWFVIISLGLYFWVVPLSYLRPLKPVVIWWIVLIFLAWFPYAMIQRLLGNRADEHAVKVMVGGLMIIAGYMAIAFVVAVFVKLALWLKGLASKATST